MNHFMNYMHWKAHRQVSFEKNDYVHHLICWWRWVRESITPVAASCHRLSSFTHPATHPSLLEEGAHFHFCG